MFVIGRKAKGSDVYAEFADVSRILFSPENDPQEVQWHADVTDPRVTKLLPQQRRGVLTLFARHPKSFERCDLVDTRTMQEET